MNKTISIILLIFTLLSCKNNKENKGVVLSENQVLTITELFEVAGTSIDKEIRIKGTVDHVCSHSGRRCFLIDTLVNETIRVEAAGEIESFGNELLGKDIIVSGIVKEQQLKASEINEWETDLRDEIKDGENGGEHCSSEMDNIKSMRKWMKENNKDYYAIYYIDGIKYEAVK